MRKGTSKVLQADRADAARNRQAILKAADELFASSDALGAMSMDDVARMAGSARTRSSAASATART